MQEYKKAHSKERALRDRNILARRQFSDVFNHHFKTIAVML